MQKYEHTRKRASRSIVGLASRDGRNGIEFWSILSFR